MKQSVRTIEELDRARRDKRAVTVPLATNFRGPTPAAFVIHYSGVILLRLFRAGMFIYEKKT